MRYLYQHFFVTGKKSLLFNACVIEKGNILQGLFLRSPVLHLGNKAGNGNAVVKLNFHGNKNVRLLVTGNKFKHPAKVVSVVFPVVIFHAIAGSGDYVLYYVALIGTVKARE